MRRRLLAAIVVLAGVGAAAALAVNQMGPSVAVSLKEFKVLAPRSSKAGSVTFVVHNKGKLKHEFVVVKTNRAPGKLPLKGQVAKLTGVKGLIKPFKPGQTKKLTVKLAAGKYVLLCNLPGHYKFGQYAGFTVK
ncbi:MAG TPA: hypothetical protein VF895_08220 [Gaiellaceae bacterium]